MGDLTPLSPGDVYHSIGKQPNAEPAETTQDARPSAGYEQQQTSPKREREDESWGGGAKRWRWSTSPAENHQGEQWEHEVQHVQEATHDSR